MYRTAEQANPVQGIYSSSLAAVHQHSSSGTRGSRATNTRNHKSLKTTMPVYRQSFPISLTLGAPEKREFTSCISMLHETSRGAHWNTTRRTFGVPSLTCSRACLTACNHFKANNWEALADGCCRSFHFYEANCKVIPETHGYLGSELKRSLPVFGYRPQSVCLGGLLIPSSALWGSCSRSASMERIEDRRGNPVLR